ncbi:response regulator [Lysinibacillus sphaericus]|nr:response regulator [Lysinibacillus sphaericus]
MKKIMILDTATTRKDEIVHSLIGTTWDAKLIQDEKVVINACGGLILEKGEYTLEVE